jgi:hypothetical protein
MGAHDAARRGLRTMERTYLFWDIDGTLLTTQGAGFRAWQQAIGEVLGITDGLAGGGRRA